MGTVGSSPEKYYLSFPGSDMPEILRTDYRASDDEIDSRAAFCLVVGPPVRGLASVMWFVNEMYEGEWEEILAWTLEHIEEHKYLNDLVEEIVREYV